MSSPEEVELLPGAGEAIRLLNQHPARVVVVTNQRGIALGKMTEADLAAVNERLEDELAACGARLDGILHCPHQKGSCDCRKPGPGMFERAAREIEGVQIAGAAMVGDTAKDVEAGLRLGMKTAKIGDLQPGDPRPDRVVASLLEAVIWLTEPG